MSQFLPYDEFYKITYHSNGSGGEFDFSIILRRDDPYVGDGSELGNGNATGLAQITSIAEGIATGIEAQSAPSSIEAVPAGFIELG